MKNLTFILLLVFTCNSVHALRDSLSINKSIKLLKKRGNKARFVRYFKKKKNIEMVAKEIEPFLLAMQAKGIARLKDINKSHANQLNDAASTTHSVASVRRIAKTYLTDEEIERQINAKVLELTGAQRRRDKKTINLVNNQLEHLYEMLNKPIGKRISYEEALEDKKEEAAAAILNASKKKEREAKLAKEQKEIYKTLYEKHIQYYRTNQVQVNQMLTLFDSYRSDYSNSLSKVWQICVPYMIYKFHINRSDIDKFVELVSKKRKSDTPYKRAISGIKMTASEAACLKHLLRTSSKRYKKEHWQFIIDIINNKNISKSTRMTHTTAYAKGKGSARKKPVVRARVAPAGSSVRGAGDGDFLAELRAKVTARKTA